MHKKMIKQIPLEEAKEVMIKNLFLGSPEVDNTKVVVNVREDSDGISLIKQLIQAGNYKTPDGLIDMLVDNMFNKECEQTRDWKKRGLRGWRDSRK